MSSVQQLISQPILIHFWWELYHYIQATSVKLEDRARQCMLVGYQENHSGDCYRMWYPTTNKIVITRDLIWLHRLYFKERAPKIKMIKRIAKSKVGKGTNLIEQEVEIYQKQNDDDVVQGIEQEEAQNPEEENEVQIQEEAEEVQAQHEEGENQPHKFYLEPSADPVLELQIKISEQSEVSKYNKLPPEEQKEEQEDENTTLRRSNRAIKNQNG